MSPSESQLRAALHHGEGDAGAGDAPDADQVISRVLRLRYERRRRFTAIAGGAVAAAVVGVGATVLGTLHRDGNDSAGGSKADRAGGNVASAPFLGSTPTRGAAAPGSRGASSASAARGNGVEKDVSRFAASLSCKTEPDRVLHPSGGGAGSSGALFGAPVGAMKVCVYPAPAGTAPRSVVLGAPGAADFAHTLEAGSAKPIAASCPANTDVVGGTIEILAVDARGNALNPVVITVQCPSSPATNGTAVRYLTRLPDRFVSLLVPSSPKSLTPPERVQVSPTR